MSASAPLATTRSAAPRPIRVMIVDDAVVVRNLLSRWLSAAGEIEVVAVLRTGAEAVAAIDRVKPDVVVLDVEMPDMDGATALPQLLRRWPHAAVIVSSAVVSPQASIFLRCLDLGAADCIAKPSASRGVAIAPSFRRDIIEKIHVLGRRIQRATQTESAPAPQAATTPAFPVERPATAEPRRSEAYPMRAMTRTMPRILAIGASTGGPNAVTEFLLACGPALQRLPVIVTQHMPKIFTTIFADHLQRQLSVEVTEACAGDIVRPGRVLVAPGGRHLRLVREGSQILAAIDEGPPVNFCRPSVDVIFSCVAELYGPAAMGVVLTGMGADGLAGATAIAEAGGNILAQDEATSVVWGMPGVVAKRGICAAIEPVEGLARLVRTGVGAAA